MRDDDGWLVAMLWASCAVISLLAISLLAGGCATQRDFAREVRERKEWSRATDMHRTYINDLEDRILRIEKKVFKKRRVKTEAANG